MADKKMTQVKALEIAAQMLRVHGLAPEEIDAKIVLEEMIEKRKQPKPRKTDKLTEKFRAALLDTLKNAEAPMTNKDLQEALQTLVDAGELILPEKDGEPVTKVSPQKVANNLRVFEKDGSVIRTRGEKASDKDTFSVATA